MADQWRSVKFRSNFRSNGPGCNQPALGLLREAGLSLEPDETVATRYAFHHELYQEVIHEQLSASRRCLLHRRAGQYLETAHAGRTDASAAALAVYFDLGYHPPQASRPYRLAH